jgi:hypothetical protein
MSSIGYTLTARYNCRESTLWLIISIDGIALSKSNSAFSNSDF